MKGLDIESRRQIQKWIHLYQKNISIPYQWSQKDAPSNEITFLTLQFYQVHNLWLPDHINPKEHDVYLKFSVVLLDKTNKKFFSRTYHSPSFPYQLDLHNAQQDEESQEVEDDEEAPYLHDPFWVGFFAPRNLDLKNIEFIIELTYYVHKKQEVENVHHFDTLGFTIFSLAQQENKCYIYAGTARDALQDRNNLVREEQMFIEASVQEEVINLPKLVQLVGLYTLFGQDDSIIGLENQEVPKEPQYISQITFDDPLEVTITNLSISFNKQMEIELLKECNHILPQKYKKYDQNLIKVQAFELRYLQIVNHNGINASNQRGFNNIFLLQEDPNEYTEYPDYVTYNMANWEAKVDNCFPNSVIIFQLVFESSINVKIIGKQKIKLYVGWCVVPINTIIYANGNIILQFDIMSGTGHTFDRQGYFCKSMHGSPGLLRAKIKFDENYFKGKEKQSGTDSLGLSIKPSTKTKVVKKSALKEALFKKSNQRKLDFKEGKIKDAKTIQQELLIKIVEKTKEENYNIIEKLLQRDIKDQDRSQVLLNEFNKLLFMSSNNLRLIKERYVNHQLRLVQYQKRSEIIEQREMKIQEEKNQQFDEWIYDENTHPNIKVFYNVENFKEFIEKTHFGNRELDLMLTETLLSQNLQGIFDKTYHALEEYKSSILKQSYAENYDVRNSMDVQIQFLSFIPHLKLSAQANKEEYFYDSFKTFDNMIPSSIYFTLTLLDVNELKTPIIYYRNGRTKSEFSNSLINGDPFILQFSDDQPALININTIAEPLMNKYGIVEVWDASYHNLIGKGYLPLFTQKKVPKRQGSRSASISQSQSLSNVNWQKSGNKSFYNRKLSDDEEESSFDEMIEFNARLEQKVYPVPVITSCDIISPDLSYILGSIQICVYTDWSSHKIELSNFNKSEIKIQDQPNKSKILSLSSMKYGQNIQSLAKSQIPMIKNIGNRVDILKASNQKTDIIISKSIHDPRLSNVLQASTINTYHKFEYVQRIVTHTCFNQVNINHCIGYHEFVPLTLSNMKNVADCVFTIQLDDLRANQQWGSLQLVTDQDSWKETAKRLGYNSNFKADNHHNNIVTQEMDGKKFYQIILPALSETQILFFYNPIAKTNNQNKFVKQHKDSDTIRITVNYVEEAQEIVQGLNVRVQHKEPRVFDILRFWQRADKSFVINMQNPIILWLNEYEDYQSLMNTMELFSPDLQLNFKYYDFSEIHLECNSYLKEDQSFDAYLILYTDKNQYMVTHVYRLILMGCQYYDIKAIQGKAQIEYVSVKFDIPRYVGLKSSKPRIIQIQKNSQNGFNLVRGVQCKVPLDIMSYSDNPLISKIQCIDLEAQLVLKTLLIYLQPHQPEISTLFEVVCNKEKSNELSFLYESKVDFTAKYDICASHDQIQIIKPQMEFLPNEKKVIKCIARPESLLLKLQVKVFVHDKVNDVFDCVMFSLTYQ